MKHTQNLQITSFFFAILKTLSLIRDTITEPITAKVLIGPKYEIFETFRPFWYDLGKEK